MGIPLGLPPGPGVVKDLARLGHSGSASTGAEHTGLNHVNSNFLKVKS